MIVTHKSDINALHKQYLNDSTRHTEIQCISIKYIAMIKILILIFKIIKFYIFYYFQVCQWN